MAFPTAPTADVVEQVITGDINNPDSTLNAAYASKSTLTDQFPEDYGAVGDGVTDDSAAINNAATNGPVLLRAAVYAVGNSLTIPYSIRGSNRANTLKGIGSFATLLMLKGSDARASDLTVDLNGAITSYGVQLVANAIRPNVKRVSVVNTGARTAAVGIEYRDKVINGSITSCDFNNLDTCIRVNRDPAGVHIRRNHFKDWKNRAIMLLGSYDSTTGIGYAASNVWIQDNWIEPHNVALAVAADVRQPIQINGVSQAPFLNLHIDHNIVTGANRSHNDASGYGSADLISLHHVSGFTLSDNICRYGGDVGITVAQGCTSGTITSNTCTFNDTAGIDIGSSSGDTTSNITASDNTCLNNGQDRNGDRPAWSRAGIICDTVAGVMVDGNKLSDTQGAPTQQYGLTVQNSQLVNIGLNQITGNGTGRYNLASNSSRIMMMPTSEDSGQVTGAPPVGGGVVVLPVVFAANRFNPDDDMPRVSVWINGSTKPNECSASCTDVTATGFNVQLYRTSATSTSVGWRATQGLE